MGDIRFELEESALHSDQVDSYSIDLVASLGWEDEGLVPPVEDGGSDEAADSASDVADTAATSSESKESEEERIVYPGVAYFIFHKKPFGLKFKSTDTLSEEWKKRSAAVVRVVDPEVAPERVAKVIQPGDLVTRVGTVDVSGMETRELFKQLKGLPEGKAVRIGFSRPATNEDKETQRRRAKAKSQKKIENAAKALQRAQVQSRREAKAWHELSKELFVPVGAEPDPERAQMVHALSILVAFDDAKKANKVWDIDYRSLLAIAHAESTGFEAEQYIVPHAKRIATADASEGSASAVGRRVIGGSCEASVAMYRLLADQTFRDQRDLEGGLPMIEKLLLEDEEQKGSQGFSGQRGKDDDTMTYHEARAELGDPKSMFWLGQQFYFGRGGLVRSIEAARKWFEKAMRHGSPGASFNMGVMYMNGEGGSTNEVEALKLFEEASSQGHIGAQNALGNTYWHGTPAAEQNQSRGLEYWEKAAKRGNQEALANCAHIYQQGVDTISPPIERDARKALEYLGKAAAMGDLAATIRIGKAYAEPSFLHEVSGISGLHEVVCMR
jgi:hypothetical protein